MLNSNRIALVQVDYDFGKYYTDFTFYKAFEHLGLGYLASSLEKSGFDVDLWEGPAMDLSNEEILKNIVNTQPQIVGFTIDSYSLDVSMTLARKIKQELNDVHITVGGHLATLAPDEILADYDCIDSLIIGYGEEPIVELAKAISEGKALNHISGIYYRENGQVLKNLSKPYILDVDAIPFPRRDVLDYRKKVGYPPCARMISSRGCPYYCSYCTTHPFLSTGGCLGWIGRSPENIVEEISQLVDKYKIKTILFCDDNFVGPPPKGKERVEKIAQLILEKRLDIHFWIMCRVDAFQKSSQEFISLLKSAGLWGIFLGLESGSDSQLKRYGKGTNVKKNITAVKLLKANNIMIEAGFIMFDPFVTFEGIEGNAQFLFEIGEASIFEYFTNRLELYPGIRFIPELRKRGFLRDDYNYKSIFGYNFEDERIGNIANYVNVLLHEELMFVDEIIWNLKCAIQILNSIIERSKQDKKYDDKFIDSLSIIRDGLINVELSIGEINFKAFLRYLDIGRKDRLAQEFDEAKMEHLNSIKEVFAELKEILKHLYVLTDKMDFCEERQMLKWFFGCPIFRGEGILEVFLD